MQVYTVMFYRRMRMAAGRMVWKGNFKKNLLSLTGYVKMGSSLTPSLSWMRVKS